MPYSDIEEKNELKIEEHSPPEHEEVEFPGGENDMLLVEIEFKGRRKGVYENSLQFPLSKEDAVVVQADRGEDIGRVSLVGEKWQERLRNECGDEKETVLRLANRTDHELEAENRRLEKEARPIFKEFVRNNDLEMKLVDAEFQLDRKKLTFYFTADGRVDFRALVKDLAHHFKTRIDLRQIGARDEAKRLGGIGLCGRELCCSGWIREFQPVTTNMVKEQNLILNPQKNTGLCGRLRCCLRYEIDEYRAVNSLFPVLGTKVEGPRGEGVVEKIDRCTVSCGIAWRDGSKFSYSEKQMRQFSNWDPETFDEKMVVRFKEDPSQNEKGDGVLVGSSSSSSFIDDLKQVYGGEEFSDDEEQTNKNKNQKNNRRKKPSGNRRQNNKNDRSNESGKNRSQKSRNQNKRKQQPRQQSEVIVLSDKDLARPDDGKIENPENQQKNRKSANYDNRKKHPRQGSNKKNYRPSGNRKNQNNSPRGKQEGKEEQ
ncbi:hypothetical protein K8I28_08430 [bacterium]|nr:hypothetical protein [bacterium]